MDKIYGDKSQAVLVSVIFYDTIYPEKMPIHSDLRLCRRLAYWHKGRVIGHFPAMVVVYLSMLLCIWC